MSPVNATMSLPSGGTDPGALARAARDFEAMAIGQLLQPMFETLGPASPPFGGGTAEEAWRPMLVDAMAKQIAAAGGFGIAGPVLAHMLRAQEQRAGGVE